MNLKRLRLACELLIEQMNHWSIFPIALTIMGINREFTVMQEPDLLLWVICSLFPLVFFFLRKRVERILPFFLLHGAALGLTFLLPVEHIILRVICILCAFWYLLQSVLMRFKRGRVYTEPYHLPVMIGVSAGASLLAGAYPGTGSWRNYYIFSLIAVLGLFFIIFYLRRYQEFLSANESSAGYLPASEMFHSGLGMALVFTMFGVVALALSTHLNWLGALVRALFKFFMDVVRYLYSLLPWRKVEAPFPDELGSGQITPAFPRSNGANWLWQVMELLVGAVLLGILLFFLFKLAVRLILLIRENLRLRRGRRSELQEEYVFDIRERCEPDRDRQKKRQTKPGPLSNNDRIRRLYKKRILTSQAQMTGADSSRLGIYTAREWERRLLTQGMADLYDQARYSGQETSAADVKKMKEVCRQ